MMAGPHGGIHDGPAAAEPLGSQWTDNVVRMHLFLKAHPHVSILNPRISGTLGEWVAAWIEPSADPKEDGTTQRVGAHDLGPLMNHLEARFKPAERKST
jgi:hypothetical protein